MNPLRHIRAAWVSVVVTWRFLRGDFFRKTKKHDVRKSNAAGGNLSQRVYLVTGIDGAGNDGKLTPLYGARWPDRTKHATPAGPAEQESSTTSRLPREGH